MVVRVRGLERGDCWHVHAQAPLKAAEHEEDREGERAAVRADEHLMNTEGYGPIGNYR